VDLSAKRSSRPKQQVQRLGRRKSVLAREKPKKKKRKKKEQKEMNLEESATPENG